MNHSVDSWKTVKDSYKSTGFNKVDILEQEKENLVQASLELHQQYQKSLKLLSSLQSQKPPKQKSNLKSRATSPIKIFQTNKQRVSCSLERSKQDSAAQTTHRKSPKDWGSAIKSNRLSSSRNKSCSVRKSCEMEWGSVISSGKFSQFTSDSPIYVQDMDFEYDDNFFKVVDDLESSSIF